MSVESAILIGFVLFAATVVIVAVFLRRRPRTDKALEFADKTIVELSRRLELMQQTLDKRLNESQVTLNQQTKTTFGQIDKFANNIADVSRQFKQLQERVDKITSFQDLFKTPKTTGKWGEAQLNHLLGEYFPREIWEAQHYFSNGEAVDAVVRLPNKKLLPIDSKLNFVSFEKMVSSSSEEREGFRKDFIRAVREEVDKIAAKYVNPQEGTTDLAVMFISAESVYYEIVNSLKDEDLTAYAWHKKVVLASPNTLYIVLSTLQHWFGEMAVREDIGEMISRLEGIKKDALKLQDEFKKLGRHLGDASKTYGEFDHRLSLLTDRVQRVIKTGEEFKEIEKQDIHTSKLLE